MNTLYDNNRLYDLVHEKPPDSESILFYRRQIECYGQPVLELACGTGSYLVPLLQNNIDITGVDLSHDMLEGALQRAKREHVKATVLHGDMRNFSIERKFALIFIAGNSLQHLSTREDVEMCFESVKQHLAPGGRFIVEVFNPSIKLLDRDPGQRYFRGRYETENGTLALNENVRYEPATQLNYIDWHFRDETTREEQTVSFTMRQFFPLELDALFHYSGFTIEQKFGNFDESSFTSDSPRQIVIASKAG